MLMKRSPIQKAPLAAFLAAVLSTGSVLAQEPAPSLPPPPPAPPGTAPPPPGAPPPPMAAPAAPPAEPPVEVRFDSNEPGLRVLALSSVVPVERVVGSRYGWWLAPGVAPMYRPVCREPCSVQLVPGPYRLALAKGGVGAVPVREPVVIQGPSAIHGTYVDRTGLRVAGWVVGIGGAIGGAVMMGVSARNRETICDPDGFCFQRVQYDWGLLGGGIAVVVASVIVGSILLAQHDEAHVTVQPLTLPASGALREAPVVALGSAAPPQGASVVLHF